jgi:hypothetical protein
MLSRISAAVIPLSSVVVVALLLAQDPLARTPPDHTSDRHLPNGHLQKDEILKADHQKNLEDARALIRLSRELTVNLEKESEFVYSITTIKKAEEIEKVARRIRNRLKRI